MPIRRWFGLLLVLAFVAAPFTARDASAQNVRPAQFDDTRVRRAPSTAAFVPGQLIVKLRDASGLSSKNVDVLRTLQRRFSGLGIVAAQNVLPQTFRLDVARDADIHALARRVAADPAVQYAEPNYLRYALRGVNDPLSTFQ